MLHYYFKVDDMKTASDNISTNPPFSARMRGINAQQNCKTYANNPPQNVLKTYGGVEGGVAAAAGIGVLKQRCFQRSTMRQGSTNVCEEERTSCMHTTVIACI